MVSEVVLTVSERRAMRICGMKVKCIITTCWVSSVCVCVCWMFFCCSGVLSTGMSWWWAELCFAVWWVYVYTAGLGHRARGQNWPSQTDSSPIRLLLSISQFLFAKHSCSNGVPASPGDCCSCLTPRELRHYPFWPCLLRDPPPLLTITGFCPQGADIQDQITVFLLCLLWTPLFFCLFVCFTSVFTCWFSHTDLQVKV